MNRIIKTVCQYYDIPIENIYQHDMYAWSSEARFIIWHLLRKYTRMTFAMIGNKFNRNHSTILIGARKAPERYSDELAEIEQELAKGVKEE